MSTCTYRQQKTVSIALPAALSLYSFFLLAVPSVQAQTPSPGSQYVLIYTTSLHGSFTGEDVVIRPIPNPPVCVGSLPPPTNSDLANFPQFYPLTYNGANVTCTPGTQVNASVPITATGPGGTGAPTIQTTMGVQESLSLLSANISSSVSGMYDSGGGFVEEILYHPDVPTPVTPGNTAVFTFHTHATGSPTPNSGGANYGGSYSVAITIASDNNVVTYQGNITSATDQTLTMPPLTIGASQTYTLYVDFLAEAWGNGSASTNPLPSSSLQASVLLGCNAPALNPMPPTSQQFSINNWSGTYNLTAQDGLELDGVMLGSRYLADKMNLPYFNLKTSDFSSGTGNHCELRPDGSTAPCGARSQLVDFGMDGTSIHASYQIDQIPQNTASCLVITQTYTLGATTSGCEPTGQACNRLTPSVTYSYTPGDPSESFTSIDVAQRFQFKVDGASQNAGAFFRDNDNVSLTTPTRNVLVSGLTTAVPSDPLPSEQYYQAINSGEAGDVDNYHQTSNRNGPSFPFLDWTAGRWNVGGGCSECVHIHWRWPSYAQAFGGFGGGAPLVPTPQSVYVAVLGSEASAHPSQDFQFLVTGATLGATSGQAFWHGAHSAQQSDTLFPYGMFYLPQGNNNPLVTLRTALGGLLYNAAAGMFTQTVTIQNYGLSPLTGPFSLALDSLSSNATLANADGTTQSTTPMGSPYVDLDLGSSNQIAAGASVTAVLWFSNPNKGGITYAPRIVTGGLP